MASKSVVASGNVVEGRVQGPEALAPVAVRLDPAGLRVYPSARAHARGDGLVRVGPHAARDTAEQRRAVGGALLDRQPLHGQLEHGGDDAQPQLAAGPAARGAGDLRSRADAADDVQAV